VTLGTEISALEAQRRLKASHVTLLGVGAIGGATATGLVAAGVGSLRLLDPDRVEISNLNRQTLFRTGDVGRPKVEVAARALAALNPHVRITAERLRVRRPEQIGPLLENCDLFVLGADQPHEILLWTSDAAEASGTPWLENSYSGPRGAVSLFVPGRTPCLRCQQHHLLARGVRQRTAGGTNLPGAPPSNAVIAPTAAIAGHYGALQALYFLVGLPAAAEGSLVHLNLWSLDDNRVIRIPFWADCPACGRARRTRPRPRRVRRRRRRAG
jgi:molybdopterin-synthase adenylyltransferase